MATGEDKIEEVIVGWNREVVLRCAQLLTKPLESVVIGVKPQDGESSVSYSPVRKEKKEKPEGYLVEETGDGQRQFTLIRRMEEKIGVEIVLLELSELAQKKTKKTKWWESRSSPIKLALQIRDRRNS